MKKLTHLFAVLILSFAAFFFAFTPSVSAVPGDHITATITIGSGLSYTEPGEIRFDNLDRISSGGTTEYVSTGGNHIINLAMSFEKELMGYTFTAATVNGVNTPISAPAFQGDSYKITVPESDNYVINLTATKTGEAKYTIIWANPDVKDDIQDEDMSIQLSTLSIQRALLSTVTSMSKSPLAIK